MDTYWKDLVSMALRVFQERNDTDAVFIIKKGKLDVELDYHDNWNGGIDYWEIVFKMKYHDYFTLENRKDTIEKNLFDVINHIHSDTENPITRISIKLLVERFIDLQSVIPETKESIIQKIEEERKLLMDIATGRKSFKDDGVEDEYHKRHCYICNLATKAGFEYPVSCESLADWWTEVKSIDSYAERRKYISNLFAPVLKDLRESDNSADVDFRQIVSRSDTIKKAIDDSNVFIREGKYDSAVDRIHTALHGYLRQLLTEHHVAYENEDNLSSLYNKLHEYYKNNIQPYDVATKIKTILRSGGGIINSVNELRNNNTISHPNILLIQKREALLVIRFLNAIVDYIEDIERSIL
jgi:hypothetical protein